MSEDKSVETTKFYFLVDTADKLDRVVCVERADQGQAEAFIKGYQGDLGWNLIKRESLPPEMQFRPSALSPAVWESTTGFTPLGPRPTDPRDPNAKRNP
jgi:hypothetical protein